VYGFGVGCFMAIYRVQIEFCIVVICTVWAITFEWTEIYPHSVQKSLAIKVAGMCFKLTRL
ncbi:hypothetical protein BDZ91DRAFT_745149, partial [Kalaharituber pfeilii]